MKENHNIFCPEDYFLLAGSDSLAVWFTLYAAAARNFAIANLVECKA
jgi:hypothetical protein